jgi:hypothetical protein
MLSHLGSISPMFLLAFFVQTPSSQNVSRKKTFEQKTQAKNIGEIDP